MNDLGRMFSTAIYDPLVGFPLLAAAVLVAIAWTSDAPPNWREPSEVRRWTALVGAIAVTWGLRLAVDRWTDLPGMSDASSSSAAAIAATVVVALPMAILALSSRPTVVTVAALALVVLASPTDPTDVIAWRDVVAWTTAAWWARGVRPHLSRAGAAASILVGVGLAHVTWGTAVAATRGMEPTVVGLLEHAAAGPWIAVFVLAGLVALPSPSIWTFAAPERRPPTPDDGDVIPAPFATEVARVPRVRHLDVGPPAMPSEIARRPAGRRHGRALPTPSTPKMDRPTSRESLRR